MTSEGIDRMPPRIPSWSLIAKADLSRRVENVSQRLH